MKLRYAYRLRPGAKAKCQLLQDWGCNRWIWNKAVELLKDKGEWLKDSELTIWRKEFEWLRHGSAAAQQQVLRDFRAKRAEGKGRRTWKSAKKHRPSLNYARNGFSLKNGRLRIKGAEIPVVWSRELPSEPTSVRVYRDSIGHWYASFVVQCDEEPLIPNPHSIGIDWGVKTTATTTDSEYDLPHSEFGKRGARALARYQRMMARRAPRPGKCGSKGYRTARRLTAKQHKKVARQRKDTARKWAKKIVRDHGSIAVEDFRPLFLTRSRMASKAADGAIGMTKRLLIEHAARAGREVALIPPAYTTMTCSACGARAKHPLPLSQRTFVCEYCGHTADRDLNSARVILARAGFNPADVDAVRRMDPAEKQNLALAESGIP
jgi:putative transposase